MKVIHSYNKRQRGMATLTTSLFVLLVMTVVVLYASKTAIMEQNVASNQYRAAQALTAANAALDYGVGYFISGIGGVDQVTRGASDDTCATQPGTTGRGGKADWWATCRKQGALDQGTGGNTLDWEMFYCDPAVTEALDSTVIALNSTDETDCGTAGTTSEDNVAIVGVGYSDDRSAFRAVVQEVQGLPSDNQGPNSPLAGKGAVGVSGNWRVINRFNNFTVWSGNDMGTGSNSANTFGPLPGATFASEFQKGAVPSNASDPSDALKLSGGDLGFNADVLDNDPNLRNMTDDAFFTAFFQKSPGDKEQDAKDAGQFYDRDGGDTIPGLNTLSGLVWIRSQNATFDPASYDNNSSIGSPDPNSTAAAPAYNPIMLIVDGDVSSSGFELTGVLYVRGDMALNGGSFRGAVISEGIALGGTGNPTIAYDPYAFDFSEPPGRALLSQGTWRDW